MFLVSSISPKWVRINDLEFFKALDVVAFGANEFIDEFGEFTTIGRATGSGFSIGLLCFVSI